MFDTDLSALDEMATLAAAEHARADAEQAEVRLLKTAAHWADLHSELARATSPLLPGSEKLVCFGGEGTPALAEFAPAELGVVLATSSGAAERLVGDALDLRHRLLRLWARVCAGEVKPWIGRKCAEATRHLSVETVAVVDRRIARYAHSLSWGRIEAIIAATWMEIDPDAAADADAATQGSLGVWVKDQSTEPGTGEIFIRAEAPDALRFNASIGGLATGLGTLGDTRSVNVRRAAAVGILANPQHALDLFADIHAATADPDPAPVASTPPTPRPVKTGPDVTLYVHLTDEALVTAQGVARVEGIGPVTVDRVRSWLGHANVTVKPVIDLNDQIPVDAYEIPDRIREAVHLAIPVDCFPYATSTRRSGDIDHTIAFVKPDEGGPPGQTGLGKLGPITRFHHRVKTHGDWQVVQPFTGVFVWRTPHGRYLLVDHTGT
ncbi:MAG: DUF222 domain-containing protein, partial [Nocardioidaceae bacterium]